ncbi:MAG: phosphate acyltransferase PlsX [Dehalococcoidia bacterium]|jgi:glycerol-3-phosphate acyltransferase PlsX
MRIALDAMGGEHSPAAEVEGAVAAAKAHAIEIVLVGKKEAVEAELKKNHYDLPIVEASQVIEMKDHPSEVMRDKRDSSITVGMKLLKNKEVDAFVSAGNTGAVTTAATLILGRIEGIERPALSVLVTLPSNPVLLLDVGANANCKPIYLTQFAQMGSVYMEKIFGVEKPRVGLLSNGEEDSKGNSLVCEAHKLLRATKLNFVGNIEGNKLPSNSTDVLVTDGFTGNVLIKVGEGIGEVVVQSIKQALARRPYLKVAALILKPALRSAFSSVDYSEYGGAPLLGVNGNVIIAHGDSDAKAISSALFIAKRVVEQDIVSAIRKGIN